MNGASLEKKLAGLPLGAIRFFEQIGSTNAEALSWVETGAPDLALVVADEQTAGEVRVSVRARPGTAAISLRPPFSFSAPSPLPPPHSACHTAQTN